MEAAGPSSSPDQALYGIYGGRYLVEVGHALLDFRRRILLVVFVLDGESDLHCLASSLLEKRLHARLSPPGRCAFGVHTCPGKLAICRSSVRRVEQGSLCSLTPEWVVSRIELRSFCTFSCS